MTPPEAPSTCMRRSHHAGLLAVSGSGGIIAAQAASKLVVRAADWLMLLLRVLVAALAIGVVLAAIAAVKGVVAYGDFMYTDAVLLHAAMRVRDGFSIYPDVSAPPFLFLHYGPVYPLTVGLISRFGDLGLLETLYVARSLTVLATVVAAASIAGLSALCGARRQGAMVAAAFFITAYVIHPWAYVARTDLPALGAVLLGTFLLLRWRTLPAALVGGLLLAIGFEFKQTYGLAFLAIVLSLVWQRQWTRAVTVAAAWAILVALTALIMTSLTDDRYLEQIVGNNLLPFRVETAWQYLSQYMLGTLTLIVLAMIGFVPSRPAGPAAATVRVYALMTALSGAAASARMGSSYNYFIEATALLAVLAGVGFSRVQSLIQTAAAHAGSSFQAKWMLAAVALAIVAVGALALPLRVVYLAATHSPDETTLIDALRHAPGPVLTERHGLAVMLAGKEPIAGDPIGIASIALGGRWSPEPFHEMIRTQMFALVALDQPVEEVPERDGFPWWPPGTVELIGQHYRFERRLGDAYLYVPNTTPLAVHPIP